MKLTSTLLSTILVLSALPAQQNVVYYPDMSPTSRNAFPFGSAGIRYQAIIPQATFKQKVVTIKDIIVQGTNSNIEIVYDDIEIKMGITQQATPTANWATNNPKPTTVYRGPLRIRFIAGKWGAIGLPKPYLALMVAASDNLCIEVICWKIQGRTAPSNFYFPGASSRANRAFRYNWINNQSQNALTGTSGCNMGFVLGSGSVAFAGTGCTGSNAQLAIGTDTYPQAGKKITITLAGGNKSSLANLVLGLSTTKWGGNNLPLDMVLFGAPKCFIWNDPLVQLPAVTDANGAIKLVGTIPNGANAGTLYAHWWVADQKANVFGITSSDYATLILGN